MDGTKVELRGVTELKRALKQIDSDAPKALRAGFIRIVGVVADVARGKVPRLSGAAAGSIKPRATQKGGGIAFGGQAAPHMPWLDFGGSVGRGHVPGQAWSGAIKRDWLGQPSGEGRYIYPAIRSKRAFIQDETDRMLGDLAKDAGFDTTRVGVV